MVVLRALVITQWHFYFQLCSFPTVLISNYDEGEEAFVIEGEVLLYHVHMYVLQELST